MDIFQFNELMKQNFDNQNLCSLMVYRLGVECGLADGAFFDVAQDFYSSLNACTNSENLNNLLNNYLQKFKKLMSQLSSVLSYGNMQDLLKAVFTAMLIDNTLEYGKIQQKILKNIKKTYKSDYLIAISEADKQNLSVDGRKFAQSKIAQNLYDEDIKMYLVLKKWNDIMHAELVGNFDKFMELSTRYLRIDKTENFYNIELLAQSLLTNALSQKLYSDKELLLLYGAVGKNFIIENFGGKTLGLLRLKRLNIDTPKMWCLSIRAGDINFESLDKNLHYAVRSSANIEDGESKSFAGMFDSFLNVAHANLIDFVQKVKLSATNNRVRIYCAKNHLALPEMAVIIQEYIEPCKAGVYFANDETTGVCEWVFGNGEKLVSGRAIPQTIKCDASCVEDKQSLCAQLLKIQKQIIEEYQFLPDIEWCVVDKSLKLVQLRPITTLIATPQTQNTSAEISGVVCCGGQAKGHVCFIRDFSEIKNFRAGDILLVEYTSPEYIEIMLKSKAIIGIYGGFLCHAGIIAREFDIPCITGIGEVAGRQLINKTVIVNCDNGTIKILD